MPLDLPIEILLAILHACNNSTLAKLSIVSKRFHDLCLPILYHEVDLSFHNAKVTYFPRIFAPDGAYETSYDARGGQGKALRIAQGFFLETLLKSPELGALVHTFRWTLIFAPKIYEQTRELEHIPFPHNHTWQVFSTLTNVRRVDLASEHYLMQHEYVMNPPENLFPMAVAIKLSRFMDEKLARGLVSHRPGRIRQLIIDDLQHWGLYDEEDELPAGLVLPIIAPGTLFGIFDPLIQLSNLEILYLRKVGQPIHTDEHWRLDADLAVYKEWALLIRSIKPHICELTFEHAHDQEGHRYYLFPEQISPMDQNFHDHLLPIFLESGWQSLEWLEIVGVEWWQDENPTVISDTLKKSIREAVGRQAELVIEEVIDKPVESW